MAPKKKSSKKSKTSKKPSPKKPVGKKAAPKKIATAKKSAVKAKPPVKAAKKKTSPPASRPKGRFGRVEEVAFRSEDQRPRSAGQSGDLQGLSNRAEADSESVDELLEEGNALEAEAVKGVEDVPDADEGEIHTHEVPEDDVPEEYTDPEQ
jgi:hypothetical protein